MAKCTDCRRLEAVDTIPEKVASWIVKHCFPNTLQDERNASFTRGFEFGYARASKHARERQDESIIKELNAN